MALKSKTKESDASIIQLTKGLITAKLLGTTALMMNRLPEKARQQLLLPARRRNKAELAASLKHNPLDEYRRSVYRCRDGSSPTLVHIPDNAIKKAMAQAALDMPGATKAQIGRLVTIENTTVHLYGVPQLHMGIVRQAGPSRTPDVRTRAYFPTWACEVQIGYIQNIVTADEVVNLLAAAGMIVGIGDGRQEKGTFSMGLWTIVGGENEVWNDIVANGGRAAQEAAMENPVFADSDTEELYSWYEEEIERRDLTSVVHRQASSTSTNGGVRPS